MEIMSASKLDSLSTEKSRLFQELLPELVKRLIIDSSKSLSSIRIPSKDDIWAPGFDGIIENDEKNTYVSSGKSVWEFGTNNDSLTKINDDYEKRTINSLGIDKKETTFYLVIPKILKVPAEQYLNGKITRMIGKRCIYMMHQFYAIG